MSTQEEFQKDLVQLLNDFKAVDPTKIYAFIGAIITDADENPKDAAIQMFIIGGNEQMAALAGNLSKRVAELIHKDMEVIH